MQVAYFLILTSCSSLRDARRLARILLQKKLAACINISSRLESHYHWKGKQEKSQEFLLFIKTQKTLYSKLEKAILKNHSYSVPEIIALPILKGSPAYLNWISASTLKAGAGKFEAAPGTF